jgi:hypothetical protein
MMAKQMGRVGWMAEQRRSGNLRRNTFQFFLKRAQPENLLLREANRIESIGAMR